MSRTAPLGSPGAIWGREAGGDEKRRVLRHLLRDHLGCQMNAKDSEKLLGIWSPSATSLLRRRMRTWCSTNTCNRPGRNGQQAPLRPSGPGGSQKEKESRHAHRPLRLHDAGSLRWWRKSGPAIPCGSDFRHPQYFRAGGAGEPVPHPAECEKASQQ